MHGSVTCKEKCGPSVSVALVGAAGVREKKTVILTDESSQFHFSDVLPGKYTVEVGSGWFNLNFFSPRGYFCTRWRKSHITS